ncbi:MAG: thiamine diphosphokinase [Rhodobacterales bacterium]|nr:thiamine diphosphokinase [Rhodobacterales bacterium]MDX5413421.1 thiamine diphosphokinase [Rhodobacterales bacterium]
MQDAIVHADVPVTLIGGGHVDPVVLTDVLRIAPRLIAADGGAAHALAAGHVPEAVIGDMDSLQPADRARLAAGSIHRIAEQDSTDFDKCLTAIRAPLVLGLGFTGPRLDHQMAAFNTLVRQHRQRCILIGPTEVVMLAPPALRLDLDPGATVSLFPMGAVEAKSEGLHWPVGGLNFAPDGRVGTSNRASGPIWLAVTAPKMLLFLPRPVLGHLVETLLDRPYGWD